MRKRSAAVSSHDSEARCHTSRCSGCCKVALIVVVLTTMGMAATFTLLQGGADCSGSHNSGNGRGFHSLKPASLVSCGCRLFWMFVVALIVLVVSTLGMAATLSVCVSV